MASPGGKLSSAARLKRNAGGKVLIQEKNRLLPGSDLSCGEVCDFVQTFGVPPAFLFRLLRSHLLPGRRHLVRSSMPGNNWKLVGGVMTPPYSITVLQTTIYESSTSIFDVRIMGSSVMGWINSSRWAQRAWLAQPYSIHSGVPYWGSPTMGKPMWAQ